MTVIRPQLRTAPRNPRRSRLRRAKNKPNGRPATASPRPPPVAFGPPLDRPRGPRRSEVIALRCWQVPRGEHLCDALVRDAEVSSNVDAAESLCSATGHRRGA